MPHSGTLEITVTLCALLLLHGVAAHGRDHPRVDGGVIGELELIKVRRSDTLAAVGERHGFGYLELVRANPDVDPWLPADGAAVLLPGLHVLPQPLPREGILINLPEYRLYYIGAGRVWTFPIGIGRMGFETPLGDTVVVATLVNPAWIPPPWYREALAQQGTVLAERVPPGPDNPIGEYALKLALPGYLIHGTNRPIGVGKSVSLGCIRLYPDDIEELVELAGPGTPVQIRHIPYKAGWRGDDLLLEVHEPIEAHRDQLSHLSHAVHAIVMATRERQAAVNWPAVAEIARERSGVPAVVGHAIEPS